MTTTENFRTLYDVTGRGGWALTVDGVPFADPESDGDEPATFPTRESAQAEARRILRDAEQFYGLEGLTVTVVRARFIESATPVARPGTTRDLEEVNIRHAAPAPRTTTEYAILLPNNRLYVDAADLVRGRTHTSYPTAEDATEELETLIARAAADSIRGFTPAVVSRTITTAYTDWA